MKKYISLASLLALVACGGGGGGGSAPATSPVRAAVTDAAITSNSAITSMKSEILVPKAGGSVIARAGSVNYDGLSYTSYRLDDVNFRVATSAGENPTLNFKMDDNGRIDSLVLNVGAEKQKMFRNDETSDFRGIVYEYIVLDNGAEGHNDPLASDKETLVRLVFSPDNDPTSFATLQNAAKGKCPQGSYCRWDRIDQAFRITSNGSSPTDGFNYSDFGNIYTTNFGKYKGVTADNFADSKIHTRETSGGVLQDPGEYATWDTVGIFDEDDYDVFAGGYKISAIQHRPTESMQFTGKAVGSIYATSDDHVHANSALVDNAATLDFDATSGTETLSMAFGNWYDVTVTKTASGNNITFSDFNGVEGDNGNEFRTAASLSVDNFTTTTGSAKNPGGVKREGMLDMGYYGLNGPEEATGVVRFKETANEGGKQYEREFRAGYGMKPVVP